MSSAGRLAGTEPSALADDPDLDDRPSSARDAESLGEKAERSEICATAKARAKDAIEAGETSAEEAPCASAEQAFERHFDMVWRGLRRLGVTEAALDDATQDVFLVLHRRWSEFQRQSSLQTWIYGILLRVASDHTRRARRDSARYSAVEMELASTLATPDQLYQQREAGRLLHQSLEKLPEKERQILVLVDLEEQSVVDAAEATGIKLNTAYTRLRRARKGFEKAMRAARSNSESNDGGPR